MKRIAFIGLLILVIGFQTAMSQPVWTVNASNYQHSATITGVLSIDGDEFRSTDGLVAAFCADTCRGVAIPQYIDEIDKYLVFITIYSNVASGETITFQFYNQTIDFIHQVSNNVVFAVNLTLGTMANPYVFEVAAANNNKLLTVTPGYEDQVKAINYNRITVARGTTTAELNAGLTPPKDTGGNIVGSFVIRFTEGGAAVPLDATEVTLAMEVLVTAQDLTTRVYHIFLGNADATLSGLTVSQGTLVPAFDPAEIYYALHLPYGSPIPTVTATATDPNASVFLTQAGSIPGTAVVTVTAEDGVTTRTYSITITYNANTDATLMELTVSSGTLTPAFSPLVQEYTVGLPWGTVTVPVVTAKSTDGAASVQITPAAALPGSTLILVTAEDITVTSTYEVRFYYILNDNARLLNLIPSQGSLNPAFDPEVNNYELIVPYGSPIPTISAATENPNATRVITQAGSFPGGASVVVTAQDGITTRTYQISVNDALNTDATLKSLTLSSGTLAPSFLPLQLDYTVELPWGTPTPPAILALSTDDLATVTITAPAAMPGIAEVAVTAEDQSTKLTYHVHFLYLANKNADLKRLVPVGGTLNPAFNREVMSYTALYPIGTTVATILAIPEDSVNAQAEILYPPIIPGEVLIQVTAMDPSSVKTYTITVDWTGNKDASLSSVSLNSIPLSEFTPTRYAYDWVMPVGKNSIPALTAVTTDPKANCVIEMPKAIPGDATLKVYAENYLYFRTYLVHLMLNAQDATLSGILVNNSALTGFSPFVTDYAVTLPPGTTVVPVVTYTTTNPGATAIITQAATIPGKATIDVTSDDHSATKTYDIRFLISSGIDENTWDSANLLVYPNPSDGRFLIDLTLPFQEAITIRLTTIQGQVVYQKNLSAAYRYTERLSPGVAPGVYILSVEGQKNVLNRRLLIE